MAPRKKPIGWPAYMSEKRLAKGTAYYWQPPTWARTAGCSIAAEALGSDYGAAKRRCDEVLNPAFTEWRTRGQGPAVSKAPAVGTWDWLRLQVETAPKFKKRGDKIKRQDRALLERVANHVMKDGRRFGSVALKSITPGAADRLLEKLGKKDDGTEIARTAVAIATACKSAWRWVQRDHPTVVPALNPFEKMGLEYSPEKTRPFTLEELQRFVETADAHREPAIGTAAMISFFWMMRQTDVLNRFAWTDYRPASDPTCVRVWHHKTRQQVDVPLYDDDGTLLWPELVPRLDSAARLGTLVVMRDQLDRNRKAHLPWKPDYFRHRVAEIRLAAKIDPAAKFMGLRHGGHTAAADAELTDAQLRALSGHKTANVTLLYAQATKKQRRAGARKMLDARTKRGDLSE